MEIRQKGITLIALVITIIILLILAGVTIAMLTGENGLIKKASTASDTQIIAREKEALQLAYESEYIDKNSDVIKITKESYQQALENDGYDTNVDYDEDNNFLVTFNETDHVYVVERDGNVYLTHGGMWLVSRI